MIVGINTDRYEEDPTVAPGETLNAPMMPAANQRQLGVKGYNYNNLAANHL